MPKFPVVHVVEAHDALVVHKDDPALAQIDFSTAKDIHHVLMPVSLLEKLGREIARELKAKGTPSERR